MTCIDANLTIQCSVMKTNACYCLARLLTARQLGGITYNNSTVATCMSGLLFVVAMVLVTALLLLLQPPGYPS